MKFRTEFWLFQQIFSVLIVFIQLEKEFWKTSENEVDNEMDP